MQTQMFAATVVALFSTLVPLVSAHGYVKSIAVDGKWYPGNMPGQHTGASFKGFHVVQYSISL